MKQRTLLLLVGLSFFSCLFAKDTLSLYKLLAAENEIAKHYIDEVDEAKLVEHAIRGMLDKLDPHSTYLTPNEVKKTNESLQGNFEGIGVQFQMMEDTLLVIQPVSNGPSEKVGILAGDRIVAVNDSIIAGVKMTTDEIMSRLKGPKGTSVDLTVVRRGVDDPMKFRVVRDKIPIFSLDAAYMLQPSIGYIRLNQFGAETSEEFQKALKKLKRKGMKDLVLDLQGNGGGYLNAAIDIANEFLEHKELIVYTEGRAYPRREYVAKREGLFRKGRLVILIDEYSASASEIVAGAIQDWDRGVLVGRRTFGKGLVQRAILLPDYSMMRLTIAEYFTPTGRSIQKPYQSMTNSSSQNSMSVSYSQEIYERYQQGEMNHKDSINLNDSLRFETKNLKRWVYGGGGIVPDFFVPVDTTQTTKLHRELILKGVLFQTGIKYVESKREELENHYANFETFKKEFRINEEVLSLLKDLCKAQGIKENEAEFNTSLPKIEVQLKALVARDLWGLDEYFQIINTFNDSVLKAIDLLKDETYEEILSLK